MKKTSIKLPEARWMLGLLIILYLIGIVGFSVPILKPIFTALTPFNLMLSFLLLILYFKEKSNQFWIISVLIVLLGYLVEVAGVKTGKIFGHYSYGETLGLKWFDTPLLIGINWLMLSLAAYVIVKNIGLKTWPGALFGAFLMLAYDIVLEPVAIKTDMWEWVQFNVPIRNYVAWYVISFGFLMLLYRTNIQTENKLAKGLFLLQFLFFLILSVIMY
ncbi:carotenoid biosynthesis protein [Bacteroidota bacterium]